MNKVYIGTKARDTVMVGAKTIYEAVKETYGPVSGNVGIVRRYAKPFVTHDGVTVAKNIELSDDKRIGADIIKEAAINMDKKLGDGTTTVTILAYHILKNAEDYILSGVNPMLLKKRLETDAEEILAKLPDLSKKIEKVEELTQIATISCGDEKIGKLIAETVFEIGCEGTVTVEEGADKTTSDIIKGYTFDRGFVSPYMITDTDKVETVLTNPSIHVTNKPISSKDDIMAFLGKLDGQKELLIIGNRIEGEALNILITTKVKGLLNVVAVKAPGFGSLSTEMLEDICTLTGAKINESFGKAEKVIVREDTTSIMGATGDIASRLSLIDAQIKTSTDKESLEKRKSTLTGNMAVIKIGGNSELDMEEKKFRVDDAIFASKAALEEGYVPGGATTLKYLSTLLNDDSILKEPLQKPYQILLENAGIAYRDYEFGQGIDVKNPNETVDLRKAGVVDPTKTIKESIKVAVAVAGTALTMKAIIVEEKDEDSRNTNS